MRMLGLAIAGLIGLTTSATAADAADLFVFGDSLVDTGNADAALRALGQPTRTPSVAGYFNNRFSNGYTFADYVSASLGNGPSLAYGYPTSATYFYGGNNFSYGGAQTRDEGHSTPGHSPSFVDQLGLFATSGKTIGADDYVMITFGGNDIQQELLKKGGSPSYTPDFTATNLAFQTGLSALIAAGARNIIVTGEADVGQIPRITSLGSAGLNALGRSLSETVNSNFNTLTSNSATATGYNIQFFDLLAFEDTLLANAAANGFTNTTDPCFNDATGVRNSATCDGYLYFDRIHPTDDAHKLIGNAINRQLGLAQVADVTAVPEPATWAMMLLGVGAAGFAMRRRKGRMTTRVQFA